jgi:hypothetical protein
LHLFIFDNDLYITLPTRRLCHFMFSSLLFNTGRLKSCLAFLTQLRIYFAMTALYLWYLASLKAFASVGDSIVFQARRANGSWVKENLYLTMRNIHDSKLLRKLGLLGEHHNIDIDSDQHKADVFFTLNVNMCAARAWSMLTYSCQAPEMFAGLLDPNVADALARMDLIRDVAETYQEGRDALGDPRYPEREAG